MYIISHPIYFFNSYINFFVIILVSGTEFSIIMLISEKIREVIMHPMIGITVGNNTEGDFFLRRQYCSAILKAGGIPILLPPVGNPESAAGICNGILFTGGGDIAPSLCGITDYDPAFLFEPSPERDSYELKLARLALARDLPVLAICRGIQILNVAMGGTLKFHIDGHRQKQSREQPSHSLKIAKGSTLARLVGNEELEVNSFHHQSIDRVGDGLTVSAEAEDGIIEAVEAPGKRFCIGVQWHPEHMKGYAADILFAGLCAAAME